MEIEITDHKKFRATVQTAKELGDESKQSLFKCLRSLNEIRRCNDYDLQLIPDFVKYSWGFCFHKDGVRKLNGGMILHGLEQTFSVELDGASYPHWSLHT